jgi:quinol monooxygenase YgiN
MPDKPGNIIHFNTTSAGADQFASILERAVEHVSDERGTTMWFAGRSEDNPGSFFVVDLFTDADARAAHFGGAAAALILGEGGALLDGDPEISALHLLAGKNV